MRTVKRWLMSGGIVVAVAVAFLVAVVVGMVAGAGGIAVGDPTGEPGGAAGQAASASPSPTPTPTPSPSPSKIPVALFVGDSYTVGQGASSSEQRWSTAVARELGWTERNVAQGGTGYVSRYVKIPRLSYREQLVDASPDGVDIVVIAGGQNDFEELRADPEPVFDAVARTFGTAQREFPDARIIAVGPSTPWEVGLEARALDSAVRAAAEKHDATYVSLLDPEVVRDDLVHEDGIHVTDEGYASIANRVISQIS